MPLRTREFESRTYANFATEALCCGSAYGSRTRVSGVRAQYPFRWNNALCGALSDVAADPGVEPGPPQ